MRVLTLKTQTAANIKFPGYLEYTINFKYYFHRASGVYGKGPRMKCELHEHIYIYILTIYIGISIDIIESALASLTQSYYTLDISILLEN